MTGNTLIKLIHDFPALDEKWRALSGEEKHLLVNGVLTIADAAIGVAEIWTAMQTVKPDAEKTAVCDVLDLDINDVFTTAEEAEKMRLAA